MLAIRNSGDFPASYVISGSWRPKKVDQLADKREIFAMDEDCESSSMGDIPVSTNGACVSWEGMLIGQ